MAGYAARTKPSEVVAQEIYAKAVALEAPEQGAIPQGHARIPRLPLHLQRRQLAELEERNQCPENNKLCQEALSFSQTTLLGTRSDLDQIVDAIRKIHGQAAELARRPLPDDDPLA